MNENEKSDDTDNRRSLVPPQRSGKAIDAEASAVLSTEKTAVVFYELVKNRMQHVNSWSVISGKLSAEFQLVNKEGLEVFRKAHVGDYLRIDIMGPGGTSGSGFDWVKIEQLQDEPDSFGFRVRPTSHPSAHRAVPDHFYDDESTSTFQVIRAGCRVIVSISDRNTKPNSVAANVVDKVRNHVVAWAARARFSQIQWQSLADGLVSR
ncbi:MAG TPA: hypothetical protein VK658_20710 [Chryseolinea sp.]|nr:hypothetical protein [Chryseolinea sp.]